MLNPKYAAEFILEFRSQDRFLYRATDVYSVEDHAFGELEARLADCHIYLLGRRPRLSIVPDSVAADAAYVSFRVAYRQHGRTEEVGVRLSRDLFLSEEVSFRASPYPHRELESRDQDGQLLATTLLATFAHVLTELPTEAQDLEILYVGKGMSRNAQDRLRSHSTLQRILADCHSDDPDSEIFALVYSFHYQKNAVMFHGMNPEIAGERASERLRKVIAYLPSIHEQVELVEAAIISYLKPRRYNTHYLDFPSHTHQILARSYEADIAAIICVLDNAALGSLRIFSEAVPPSARHEVIIDFRRAEGRESLWD